MEQVELWKRGEAGPAEGVEPRPEDLRAARGLPDSVRLGTSSWSFPGWRGIVYAGRASKSRLAREGLRAYAGHPLLRLAGIDWTYYRPPEPGDLEPYARQVPEGFRFLVKAPEACTLARFPERERYGPAAGGPNPRFLDPEFAARFFVKPALMGLGGRAGPLVFQFPPQAGDASRFAGRLGEFLAALPRGPLYAVEIRNRAWLTPEYARALRAAGACHCLNVHPSMPSLDEQARVTGARDAPALAVRWMLGGRQRYERARARYAPFDRLVDPDPGARGRIAELCAEFAASGRPAFVSVNNKAEGSAPLSVFALARRIAEIREPGGE